MEQANEREAHEDHPRRARPEKSRRTVNAMIQITQIATPLLFSWRRAIALLHGHAFRGAKSHLPPRRNRMRVHIASGMP